MPEQILTCLQCGEQYTKQQIYYCPKCDGIVEVQRPTAPRDRDILEQGGACFSEGLWKYFELLPLEYPHNVITLGEGDTPLLQDSRIPTHWGMEIEFYIKAESLNPTGSFKDRPTTVGISKAKEFGQDTVVVSSSGNAATSAAAYAARGGMRCVVIVPKDTDPGKLTQAHAYGAEVVSVNGHLGNCSILARELSRAFGWTNVVSTFLNPYTVVANKTVAYELYHQLKGKVPDHICIPIGAGPLLAGVLMGYRELMAVKLVDHLPKLVGVQAGACEPITRGFREHQPVCAWGKPVHTIAGGIADPLVGYEKDGDLTNQLVRQTNGTMLSLEEAEIAQANELVEKKVGLYSEPTGAVSVGAVKKLYDSNFIKNGDLVVSLLTGHGFKFSKRAPNKLTLLENIGQAIDYFK